MPDHTECAGDITTTVGQRHACRLGGAGAIAQGAGPLTGYIKCLVINTPAAAAATGAQQGRSQRHD